MTNVDLFGDSVYHKETGEIYNPEDIAQMRAALESETNLNLSDMSNRGIVANYLARHKKGKN